jgi:hypothetical protein
MLLVENIADSVVYAWIWTASKEFLDKSPLFGLLWRSHSMALAWSILENVKTILNSICLRGKWIGTGVGWERGDFFIACPTMIRALSVHNSPRLLIIFYSNILFLGPFGLKSTRAWVAPFFAPMPVDGLLEWVPWVLDSWPDKLKPQVWSLFLLVLRSIWIERYNRIFKRKLRTEAFLLDTTVEEADRWKLVGLFCEESPFFGLGLHVLCGLQYLVLPLSIETFLKKYY